MPTLLAGAPSSRKMPGLDTWHVADRGNANDEFNMFAGMGGGDPFRGDWIDLVNDFYLTGIQELYHIGKGNVRTHVYNKIGVLHISKFVLIDPDGKETEIPAVDCLPPSFPRWAVKVVRQYGRVMLESTLVTRFNAPGAGKYRLKIHGGIPARDAAALNVYVNRQRQLRMLDISFKNPDDFPRNSTSEKSLCARARTRSPSIRARSTPDGATARWPSGKRPPWAKASRSPTESVTFATDYDRMWPDTWSGRKKIYFFSWDGTSRTVEVAAGVGLGQVGNPLPAWSRRPRERGAP